MIPFASKISTYFQSKAVLKEWKRAFQLKRDYEALSELSRYANEQLDSLGPEETRRFFELGYEGIQKDPVFSKFETYMDHGLPETLGECVAKISPEDFGVFQEHLASRIDNKIDLNNLEYLVFSGGGAKGMAYPGVLKALAESESQEKEGSLFDNIKETAGASAGALISLPLAMGYSADEIQDIVTKNRYEHFFDESIVSSHGMRAELTRLLKKVNGGLRRKLAEVEYIDVFTREMNKRLIRFSAELLENPNPEHESTKPSSEKLKTNEDYVKTYLMTMTHHDMMRFCETLDKDFKILDQWVAEASEVASRKVKGRLFNYFTRKFPEFGGFNSSFEAMRFSLRRFYGADKIEEFLADIIEDSLDKVPEKELERVVSSMTTKADEMLCRNVAIILDQINKHAIPRMKAAGYPIGKSDGWRAVLDQMITQNEDYHGIWKEHKGYHWGDLFEDVQKVGLSREDRGMDRQEINTALSALRELDNHSFLQALQSCKTRNGKAPDYDAKGEEIKSMLPKWAFMHQRRLYKRNINFLELEKLADGLPQYGFKKLHVTMCRLHGKANIFRLAFDNKDYMADRYQLAMANHLSNDYSRMPIKTASRISMNLPVGFEKKKYYGEKFIDGGVVSNTPSHVFMEEPYNGQNRTLTCMLGDNSFFEGGRHIKEALKGSRVSRVDRIRMITSPLIPVGKFISWVAYKLNPNYEKINNDDLWRSLFVQTGDVSTGDFGVNEDKKLEIIENARKDTLQFLNNEEDAQLNFLNARLKTMETWLESNGYDQPEKSPHVEEALRKGVFSTGRMSKMHEDMASRESMKKHLKKDRSLLASQGMGL